MKVIIFDVDGVIINSKDEAGNHLWKKNIQRDLGLSPEQMRQIYADDWTSVIKGHRDVQSHFKAVFDRLNIALSADIFVDYWLGHDTNINTEILPVLTSIKDHKLYIGTNQEKSRTAVLEKKFGAYFDGVFSSYQIGAIKPEVAFYNYIESSLNVQPQDIAFIDDSLSHVQAAQRCGWTGHHYQNIDGLKDFLNCCKGS